MEAHLITTVTQHFKVMFCFQSPNMRTGLIAGFTLFSNSLKDKFTGRIFLALTQAENMRRRRV